MKKLEKSSSDKCLHILYHKKIAPFFAELLLILKITKNYLKKMNNNEIYNSKKAKRDFKKKNSK